MVWKRKDDNNIPPVGTMFTYRNRKYPATWNTWDNNYKVDMGLYWEDDPVVPQYDARFYTGVKEDGSFIEKDLAETKKVFIGLAKQTCGSNLQLTDWYAIRKADTGTAIPDNIAKYRTETREACKTIEDSVNACSSMADLKKLFDADKDGIIPMYKFPSLEDY